MPNLILKPEVGLQPYRVAFHVRVPARADPEILEHARTTALERMTRDLERRGWHFARLLPERPRGPLPVVPVKGFGKRPIKIRRKPGQASAPEPRDDSLWRVSTLPTFGPKGAHLMTDQVEWEFYALFVRPTIATEYLHDKGEPEPTWRRQ